MFIIPLIRFWYQTTDIELILYFFLCSVIMHAYVGSSSFTQVDLGLWFLCLLALHAHDIIDKQCKLNVNWHCRQQSVGMGDNDQCRLTLLKYKFEKKKDYI